MPDGGKSGRAFNSVSPTQVRGRFQGRDGRFRARTQNMRIRPGDANPYDLHESIRGFLQSRLPADRGPRLAHDFVG